MSCLEAVSGIGGIWERVPNTEFDQFEVDMLHSEGWRGVVRVLGALDANKNVEIMVEVCVETLNHSLAMF